MSFGWPRWVRTNMASRYSAGPDSNSIRWSQPSPPISWRTGSSRTRTPALSSTARSPFRFAGPSVQEHDVVAPTRDHQGRARRRGAGAVHGQRQVAHLPAVAERAVEDRPAPEPGHARQRRRVVAQPVREHQRAAAHRAAVEPHGEAVRPGVGVEHLGVPDLDVGEAGQLLAAGLPQVRGGHACLRQQAPDSVRGGVGGPPRVEHQHALPRAAQHQGGAESGGAAADDHGIEHRRAVSARVRVAAAAVGGVGVRASACVHLVVETTAVPGTNRPPPILRGGRGFVP